jgi:hypothetical protein
MIPEFVPVTTSVTTARPGHWDTPLGGFDFRHIQVGFFDGYQRVDLGGDQRAFVAGPEKALLDLVYLEPGGETLDYLVELRLGDLNRLDWKMFAQLVERIEKPKLSRAANAIRRLAEETGDFVSL